MCVLGLGDTSNTALRLLQQHNIAIIANIALECCAKVNALMVNGAHTLSFNMRTKSKL